jgi:hypothetical protein
MPRWQPIAACTAPAHCPRIPGTTSLVLSRLTMASGVGVGARPQPGSADRASYRFDGRPGQDDQPAARPDDQHRQLRRGVHKSVAALEKDIRTLTRNWNENPRPFAWTKPADEIFERLQLISSRIPGAGHWLYSEHRSPGPSTDCLLRAQCPLPTGATQAATVTPKCFRVVSEPWVTPVKYPEEGATSA